MHDVVIIGAGPAGLRVAQLLIRAGLSVAVLEATSEVGGRTRSVDVADERVNTGAMFVYTDTESHNVCEELGIETFPVEPDTFGVHVGGVTVVGRTDEELVAGAPVPADARADLERLLHSVRSEYAKYVGSGDLRGESSVLEKISFTEHLGDMHPVVNDIVRNAVLGGSTAEPEDLSAQYALRYFASYLVRSAGHRRYIPSGMQEISRRLADTLPDGVLQLRSEVSSVTRSESGAYRVEREGFPEIEARHVVFAVPGPIVARLAPWLPDWKLAAIAAVPTNPVVSLGITLDCDGVDWADLYCIATVGAPFNMVLQPKSAVESLYAVDGRTTFMCYRSADLALAQRTDDDALVTEWLEHFYAVVPNSRGRVLGTHLTRWELCFAYPRIDRAEWLAGVRAEVGGMHFAGDYTSATAGTHGALEEAARVADALIKEW